MRLIHNPVSAYVLSGFKLLWDRITFSRLTAFYFAFSLVHFIIQVSLQFRAFTINQGATAFLEDVVAQGNVSVNGFPVLRNDFRICHRIPASLSVDHCTLIWNGTVSGDNFSSTNYKENSAPQPDDDSSNPIPLSSSSPSSTFSSPSFSTSLAAPESTTVSNAVTTTVADTVTITVLKLPNPARTSILPPPAATVVSGNNQTSIAAPPSANVASGNNNANDNMGYGNNYALHGRDYPQAYPNQNTTQVILNSFGWQQTVVNLDQTCLIALSFPVEVLNNTKREDIIFIAFHFWVLGMSVVALLNESIPHILASLLTHVLATSWAGFQLTQTAQFHDQFSRLTVNGACSPINLLKFPDYWLQRRYAEIPILALNVLALFVSVFLTWKLIKLFGWQTFKRVGASLTINRVYKFVLILSITIQLSFFFIIATAALWIDQLYNGDIGKLADLKTLYRSFSIATLIVMVPWLITGWFATRRELRSPMLIFLLAAVGYMGGWAAMFVSTSFRWTFIQWPFFSIMASASVLLTSATLILGIVCMINFGKGLLRYLQAQERLESDGPYNYGVGDDDSEKVSFPSRHAAIPTFSITFGSGAEVPPPSQMKFAPARPTRKPVQYPEELSDAPRPLPSPPGFSSSANASQGEAGGITVGMRSEQGNVADALPGRSNSQSSGKESIGNPKRWIIE